MKKTVIITPFYNNVDKVSRVIKYYSDFDFISLVVVDDGSKVDVSSKIKNLCSLNNVKYIKQENSGPSKARLTGLEFSEYEFVFFLDSDDFINPYAIIDAVNKLKNSDADFVTFKSDKKLSLDEKYNESLPEYKIMGEYKNISQSNINSIWCILSITSKIGWNQSNTLYRNDVIKSIYSDVSLRWAEDIPLKTRLHRKFKGLSFYQKDVSIIEISYGRGYLYKMSDIFNLASYFINMKDIGSIRFFLSFLIIIRYSLSFLYKKIKVS